MSSPQALETGADAAMERYGRELFGTVDALIDQATSAPMSIDRDWPRIADAIRACVAWSNPILEYPDLYEYSFLQRSNLEWAQRAAAGRYTAVDEMGWQRLLDFLAQLRFEPLPFERDWTVGPIEVQHSAAIPLRFDWRASLDRIRTAIRAPGVDDAAICRAMARKFHAFVDTVAHGNGHPLELMSTDIIDAFTSRSSWEVEWAFVFPTYFGQPGVLTYNQLVAQSPIFEATIVRFFDEGGEQS